MSKANVSRLVPKVPGVPGLNRRQAYSASTKRSLVEVAEGLFTEHGYAATSLEAIVTGAEVTKGALYHHFSGKRALFEAVFEEVELRSATTIHGALADETDPWSRARAGLRSFLAVVDDPRYRRIVVQDGPAVLGFERFREQEERTTFAIVVDIVRAVLQAGSWELDEAMVTTFARVFFGAMTAAGDAVTAADDHVSEARRVEAVIGTIIAGFQSLEAAGIAIPVDPTVDVTAGR